MTQMQKHRKLAELEERAKEMDTALFCSAVEDATYLKIKNPHTRAEVEQEIIGYALDGKTADELEMDPNHMEHVIDNVFEQIDN